MTTAREELAEIKRHAREAFLNGEVDKDTCLEIVVQAELDAILAEKQEQQRGHSCVTCRL